MSGVKLVHFNADIYLKKKSLLEYISVSSSFIVFGNLELPAGC